MLFLQNNWQIGMTVCCLVVGLAYIGISLLILFKVRKAEGDICCTAFIPFVNIIQLMKYENRYSKKLKGIKLSQEIKELEDEEIDL